MNADAQSGSGDPTQRLLTALGRFHRQVAKAQDGAAQELWSDECMNQLINAVEIAVAESWRDLVTALTDTARILQSYEDAGSANACVSFLQESYEILCLMVGDLIVGSVRPGVMQKWRERYAAALENLAAAGIPLVQEGEGAPAEPAPEPEEDEAQAPGLGEVIEEAPIVPGGDEEQAEDALAGDEDTDGSGLGGLAPLGGPEEAGQEPVGQEPVGQEPVDEALLGLEQTEQEPEPLAPFHVDDAEPEPSEEADWRTPDFGQALAEEEEVPAGTAAPEVPEVPEDTEEQEVPAEEEEPGPETVAALDRLCDTLLRIENEVEPDLARASTEMGEHLDFLEHHAETLQWPGSLEICNAMRRLCQRFCETGATADERFFELAYAFCGLYVEARMDPEDAQLQNWIEECRGLETPAMTEEEDEAAREEPMPEPETELEPEHAPGPEPELEPELTLTADEDMVEAEAPFEPAIDDVPAPIGSDAAPSEAPGGAEAADDGIEDLLETAQRAITEGHAVDAKLLALKAASSIARAQVRHAEASVREAEEQLRENAEAIKSARVGLQQAEQAVIDAESAVAANQQQLAEAQAQTEELATRVTNGGARIVELDEQIAALQKEREEEIAKQEEATADLAGRKMREAEAISRTDEFRQTEEAARVRLEDVRQQVKLFEQKQTELETAVEHSRELLGQQQVSLEEIEQTFSHASRGDAEGGEDKDELLF